MLFALCGCQGGRLTWFDPVKTSLADGLVVQGDSYLQDGQRDAARSILLRALRIEPHHAVANGLLGDIAAADGDIASAVQYYRRALKSNPNNVTYAIRLGDCLGKLAETAMSPHREWGAAARAYGHARALERDNYDVFVCEARCLRAMGEYSRGIELLDRATSIAPEREDAYLESAQLWMELGRRNDALAACRLALGRAPFSSAAHNLAAAILLESSGDGRPPSPIDISLAAEHLKKSLEIDANQPAVHGKLTELVASRGPVAARGAGEAD